MQFSTFSTAANEKHTDPEDQVNAFANGTRRGILITVFLILLGDVLSVLPLYQRTFILTISLVPWMVFIGLPMLEFLLRQFSAKPASK